MLFHKQAYCGTYHLVYLRLPSQKDTCSERDGLGNVGCSTIGVTTTDSNSSSRCVFQSSICKYHLISSVIKVFTVSGGDMIDSKQGDEVSLLSKLCKTLVQACEDLDWTSVPKTVANLEDDTRIGELFWCNIHPKGYPKG